MGQERPEGRRGQGPSDLNSSHKSAPGLDTAQVELTLTVSALPRPEMAPACC